MTSSSPRIDISGDESLILCTQEDAISWFSALKEEFGVTVSGLGGSSFTINFVTKADIQNMNKKFAGKNKPTNVLSFPADKDFSEDKFLGDIAICSELIIEEAKSQGKNTKHHLIHIFIHAVLHLLGFDHEEQSSAERMESIEVNILKKIGVADPY
tara:strand:+ start:34 stop:501 length:468 start_codon:yes stop_codon:yes gene_type:complete